MEKRMTEGETTLILVTHDRVFMEAVCTGILELDQGIIHAHAFGGTGSYDRFRQVSALRHAHVQLWRPQAVCSFQWSITAAGSEAQPSLILCPMNLCCWTHTALLAAL